MPERELTEEELAPTPKPRLQRELPPRHLEPHEERQALIAAGQAEAARRAAEPPKEPTPGEPSNEAEE